MKDMPNIPTKDRPDLVSHQGIDDDGYDDPDTLGNDLDVSYVTQGYNVGLDKY